MATAEAKAALQVFEGAPALRDADEAAALLRSLGSSERRSPRLGATLTKREAEVLELLAHGLTNAQIAERLFVSPKTAEHHVGHILPSWRCRVARQQRRTPSAALGKVGPDRGFSRCSSRGAGATLAAMETHTQTVSPRGERLSRESLIGLLALTLTVVVMAVEQLADSNPGLVDPIGFMSTPACSWWRYLFFVAVPRIKSHPSCRGVAAPLALVVSLATMPTMLVAPVRYLRGCGRTRAARPARRPPQAGRCGHRHRCPGDAAGARIPGSALLPPRRRFRMAGPRPDSHRRSSAACPEKP